MRLMKRGGKVFQEALDELRAGMFQAELAVVGFSIWLWLIASSALFGPLPTEDLALYVAISALCALGFWLRARQFRLAVLLTISGLWSVTGLALYLKGQPGLLYIYPAIILGAGLIWSRFWTLL